MTDSTTPSAPATRDLLSAASTELRRQATNRFDRYGPGDPRGAAFWDVAAWLDPDDHNALELPTSAAP